MGARVVLVCRNPQRGEDARRRIAQETGNDMIELEILDCESFASVHAFLERWEQRETKKVDILVNNAGLSYSNLTKTSDGFEAAYQCNHLSHVLLTHTLLNRGHFTPKARIISVSAFGFYLSIPLDERNADASHILSEYTLGKPLPYEAMMQTYRGSKAGQAIWTMILQDKLSRSEKWKDIVVQACHPGTTPSSRTNPTPPLTPKPQTAGMVKSSIWTQPAGIASCTDPKAKTFISLANKLGISNEQGAAVPVWLATADKPAQPNMRGLFWDRMDWKWVPGWSLEKQRQERLWNKWCEDAGAEFV
ncbi:hypothetical protein FRC06_001783 [Ceratobasidium sp. 370]|nr:hypothetical protein FRC06_001783 [Ceratobasidium sp. 370]